MFCQQMVLGVSQHSQPSVFASCCPVHIPALIYAPFCFTGKSFAIMAELGKNMNDVQIGLLTQREPTHLLCLSGRIGYTLILEVPSQQTLPHRTTFFLWPPNYPQISSSLQALSIKLAYTHGLHYSNLNIGSHPMFEV